MTTTRKGAPIETKPVAAVSTFTIAGYLVAISFAVWPHWADSLPAGYKEQLPIIIGGILAAAAAYLAPHTHRPDLPVQLDIQQVLNSPEFNDLLDQAFLAFAKSHSGLQPAPAQGRGPGGGGAYASEPVRIIARGGPGGATAFQGGGASGSAGASPTPGTGGGGGSGGPMRPFPEPPDSGSGGAWPAG